MVTIGFAAGGLDLGLWLYWLEHSPSVARPATGQTYPCNNHGHIFDVTQSQNAILDGLIIAFGVFGFGGAILNLRWKVVRNLYDDLPRKLH